MISHSLFLRLVEPGPVGPGYPGPFSGCVCLIFLSLFVPHMFLRLLVPHLSQVARASYSPGCMFLIFFKLLVPHIPQPFLASYSSGCSCLMFLRLLVPHISLLACASYFSGCSRLILLRLLEAPETRRAWPEI